MTPTEDQRERLIERVLPEWSGAEHIFHLV
jgi:hypothetical protein